MPETDKNQLENKIKKPTTTKLFNTSQASYNSSAQIIVHTAMQGATLTFTLQNNQHI